MKKTFVTAIASLSALTLAGCAGDAPEESVEETAAEADAMVEDAEAMTDEAEDMMEDGGEAAEATAEEANPVEGTGNPIGPQEQ